jgi:hypothetical protein
MGYGEDRDLWSRLVSEDSIVWLDHKPIKKSIGYDRTQWEKLQTIVFEMTVVLFRSGISYQSFIKFRLRNVHNKHTLAQLVISPLAYLQAIRKGIYKAPSGFKQMGKLQQIRKKETKPLSVYEEKYGFSLQDELTQKAVEVFYPNKMNRA